MYNPGALSKLTLSLLKRLKVQLLYGDVFKSFFKRQIRPRSVYASKVCSWELYQIAWNTAHRYKSYFIGKGSVIL
jgi:hypothetical protein